MSATLHSTDHAHASPGFLKKYIFSTDHKIIGIQFLFLGLMFFAVGGLLAMLIRWQLGWSDPKTQGKEHPVPILAKMLWSTVDATSKLGVIGSIDPVTKSIIINQIGDDELRNGDTVKFQDAAGRALGTGTALSVDDGQAIITPEGAPVLKAGDAVFGKRVPGPMPPDFYNMVFTMHATIMIFLVIIPLLVGTFGNYLIPLKIGAADMAFPFLNGMAFWAAVPGGAILIASFFMPGGAASAGWTSYPPLSSIIANGQTGMPWDQDKWLEYRQPKTALEKMGEKLRIKGEVIKLSEGRFDGKGMTFDLPENEKLETVEKTKTIAGIAIAEYRKTSNQELKGYAASIKSEAGKSTLTIAGTDEKTLRNIGQLAQRKMTWRGSWSDASVIAGLAAFCLFIGFVCTHQVNVGHTALNVVLAIIITITAAYFLNKGVQYAAFDGQSAWFLSVIWLGFASLMGAVNYLTTIIKLRCRGMTMFRLPLSVWSLFITSLLVLLATPVLASALSLNLLDHHRFTSFFMPLNWVLSNSLPKGGLPAGGGYPVLHQHLFWFYSHPAVYIMILPAMGMVSDILAVFSRKPVFGYRPMVYAMAGIAFLGFIVWAHHMFQSGMNPTLGTAFAVATMFIAVPSAIKTFNWLGTLWRGNIRFTSAMLNALAFVSMFVIGGLSGIFMASTAVDVHIHDTYFIVAHIHYVLFGGSTFGIFAAIYFWYPKMFGRMMNEKLGKIHFYLSFISFNLCFFTMHILGLRGFPRRVSEVSSYPGFEDLKDMNLFITYSAFALGLAQIPFAINFLGSWIWGKKASANPWDATTLEWVATSSPPPHGNFLTPPVVYHGPYEYSTPLVEADFLPQNQKLPGGETVAQGH